VTHFTVVVLPIDGEKQTVDEGLDEQFWQLSVIEEVL